MIDTHNFDLIIYSSVSSFIVFWFSPKDVILLLSFHQSRCLLQRGRFLLTAGKAADFVGRFYYEIDLSTVQIEAVIETGRFLGCCADNPVLAGTVDELCSIRRVQSKEGIVCPSSDTWLLGVRLVLWGGMKSCVFLLKCREVGMHIFRHSSEVISATGFRTVEQK